jgi:hypothetical protein
MRLAFFAILLVGCSGGSFDVASTQTDAAAGDTVVTEDSNAPDSSVEDTGASDTNVTPDAPPPVDTGMVVDTGPTCPASPSTKVWDVTDYKNCLIIRDKYTTAVDAAKACTATPTAVRRSIPTCVAARPT